MSLRAKICSIISYIPPFFFAGLILENDDPVVRYHANQGLIVFILYFLLSISLQVFSFIFRHIFIFFQSAASVLSFAAGVVVAAICITYTVIGIVNAASNKCSPLPLIGEFNIIK